MELTARSRASVIDQTTKGFGVDEPTSIAELVSQRPSIFDGPFVWPLMVLDGAAMHHNIDLHAEFCRARGFELAPHGKTMMAPAIFAAQFAAGAWGMTAATISQVRAYRAFGIDRIVLANELVDYRGLRWLLDELERSPELEFWCWVDSVRGVELLGEALTEHAGSRNLHVLVELGHHRGRTGVRTRAEAIEVARATSGVQRLQLDGVALYEGTISGASTEQNLAAVAALVDEARHVVESLCTERLLDRDRVIVSAGGSAYFDVVADHLSEPWPEGITPTLVLRSGAYVTHDDGLYEDISGYGRLGTPERPRPALHLWALVVSRPEHDLALAGFGKRDAPIDAGMPVPTRVRRSDGTIEPLEGWTVTNLNDHHAHLYRSRDDATAIEVGELIEVGISHPCTAFDRWKFIPIVDEEYRVVDCAETFF